MPSWVDAVEVVGEAEDAQQAVAVITATRPDVVLLDVHLPGGGGRAVLQELVGELPEVKFLALSVSATRPRTSSRSSAAAPAAT